MKTVTIPAGEIQDTASFHDVFARTLGFPSFYGRNMDAWVDCMESVDDPAAGMTTVTVAPGEVLVLAIADAEDFKDRCPDLWQGLLESAAFVNWQRMDRGRQAVLAVAA